MLYATRFRKLKPVPMQGPDVQLVQTILNDLGFNPGKINGRYTKKTYALLKQFQQYHDLKADGIVGPKTWKRLLREEKLPEPHLDVYKTQSQPVINVHVDTRILNLVYNQTVRTFPVAVGRPSLPTPSRPMDHCATGFKPRRDPSQSRWMRLSIPGAATVSTAPITLLLLQRIQSSMHRFI